MAWSLVEKGSGKNLPPLWFSNGKTQQDIVEEVLEAIKQGCKFVFIKGVCGTGKSAIALNIAKELGQTSIVVPLRSLQKQYEDDYTKKIEVMKNGKPLKITVLTGRRNHACLFSEGCNCDNPTLPCKIEIKEENISEIRRYLKQNQLVDERNFKTLKDVRRKSLAPVCEHWMPIVPDEMLEHAADYLLDVKKKLKYKGLEGKNFNIFVRKPGCGYYDQFLSYVDSDVMVFNSKKYELETYMDRKPATVVEIIDECDKFLDDFANERRINLHMLSLTLFNIEKIAKDNKRENSKRLSNLVSELNEHITDIINDPKVRDNIAMKDILELKKTKMLDIVQELSENELLEEYDELESFCDSAKSFSKLLNETFVLYNRNMKNEMVANLITISLEKKLAEFREKNNVFVMMSGTIHSPAVLQGIFGIKEGEYKIIEAETEQQGKISRAFTGLERNFRHSKFASGEVTREQYLKALAECVKKSKKPVLIHVNSFSDLPTEQEREQLHLYDLETQERMREMNRQFGLGQLIQKFKNKEVDILYSTTSTRGMDFPGEMCNTIILTKFPYPQVNSLFMKILKKSKPKEYDSFYFDMARREFVQRVYRGLRSKTDKVYLMSPDIQVLQNNLFKYD